MAVAYDTSGSGGNSSSSSVSFAITVGSNSDRVVYALVTRGNADAPSSITFGGSAMTLVGSAVTQGTASNSRLYRLIAPSTGSQTFTVNWSGNSNCGAVVISLYNVHQTTPDENSLSSWSATSGNPSGIDVSGALAAGDLAIGFAASHGNSSITITATAGTSTDRQNQTNPNTAWMSFDGLTDTAGTPTWTISAGDTRTAYACAIHVVGGGGGGGGMLARFTWPGGIGRPIGAMVGGFDG